MQGQGLTLVDWSARFDSTEEKNLALGFAEALGALNNTHPRE
jgi:hypothetical protein